VSGVPHSLRIVYYTQRTLTERVALRGGTDDFRCGRPVRRGAASEYCFGLKAAPGRNMQPHNVIDDLSATRVGRLPRQPVLMVVHAHPDDESSQTGGTLAVYSAAGWRTILITCTDGSQGDGMAGSKPGQAEHDPTQVAERRSRELDMAAVALGIHEVIKLGFPDSGVSTTSGAPARKAFSRRPLQPMVDQLRELIELHRPDVVVTYPPNGLSGHPDHIRTHTLVLAALRAVKATTKSAANKSQVAELPLLYYVALSRSRLRASQARARAALGPDTWVLPAELAVDDTQVTTVIDITAHWRDKLRALSAHASQSDAATLLTMFAATEGHGSGVYVEEYVAADDCCNGQPLEPGFGGIAPVASADHALSAAGMMRSDVRRWP
jgi:LmbE family N-acetylglucosaminyl deacetylase